MKKITASALALLTTVMPAIALAAPSGGQDFGVINVFLTTVANFINGSLIPLVLTVSLLVFIYGMFEYYIRGGADEAKRAQGRGLIIGAVIGFVAMIIIWGVVNLIANGLITGLGQNTQSITVPKPPTPQ